MCVCVCCCLVSQEEAARVQQARARAEADLRQVARQHKEAVGLKVGLVSLTTVVLYQLSSYSIIQLSGYYPVACKIAAACVCSRFNGNCHHCSRPKDLLLVVARGDDRNNWPSGCARKMQNRFVLFCFVFWDGGQVLH